MRLVAIIRQYIVENAHRKHIHPLTQAEIMLIRRFKTDDDDARNFVGKYMRDISNADMV